MDILDFGRSFIHGRAPKNSVRFWVESVTRVIDEREGVTEDYYQCGACKSENTFAERDLLKDPNYDFTPVFGPVHTVVFRRQAEMTEGYRDTKPSGDMWDGQIYRLRKAEGARLLTSNDEIRAATHDAELLVARTEIWNDETGLRAVIQYPVKTMNIHDGSNLYQVDTGPVAWPDLSKRPTRLVDTLSLAFIVFNAPDFADAVIEVPTPVGEGRNRTATVYHYSRIVSVQAKNELYAHT